jgi:uncharacterized protein YbbC (DUF1343 family)
MKLNASNRLLCYALLPFLFLAACQYVSRKPAHQSQAKTDVAIDSEKQSVGDTEQVLEPNKSKDIDSKSIDSMGNQKEVDGYLMKKLNPKPAAELLEKYIDKLKGKRIGLVINQTSLVGQTHLLDTLRSLGLNIKRIYAPEHGFRGTADAGEHIKTGFDDQSGIPISSLYGASKAPSKQELAQLDLIVFDIQDVGVRFYTYLSTLYYVMDACATHNTPLMVLDRPNPNGHYCDGPVLDLNKKSFVGVVQVPIVHGCTLGELAHMINGEGWLPMHRKAKLSVITCEGYTHSTRYNLPVPPSPNLRSQRAIYLYPSLCLFEGTQICVGRGTETPFEVYGHPKLTQAPYQFKPQPNIGAKSPLFDGQICFGYSLQDEPIADLANATTINWNHLLSAYAAFPDKSNFFLKSGFFDQLVGNTKIKELITNNASELDIRQSYTKELAQYIKLRSKYLLYHE